MDDTRPAYSTKDVSRIYSVHCNTVRKMVKLNKLRAGSAGKKLLFDPAECDRVFKGIEPLPQEK